MPVIQEFDRHVALAVAHSDDVQPALSQGGEENVKVFVYMWK